ncbi:MAG: restriction endonuclease subunit S [Pseudomonadaceae bacterium]|uniref:restriction endonuclease subunit S n=1 Tax=Pseudomonas sp. Ga0074129 TaxID=1752219 RepID=UPI000AC389B7|nr:restriction endonuclease subunit S [Pseudomonas sp. Ga0074129]MBX9712619.1 restriction endonuclease subunit S [Pseudomonadaceae bacterium]
MSETLYEQRPLGDAVERHIGGGTPSRQVPSYWKGEIPWASVKDFPEQKGVIQDTEEHISSAGLHASASNLIPAQTPLVCTRMAVGRAALPVIPMAINQDVKALFPALGVYAEYLLKLIQYIQPLAEGRAVGSTVKGIRIQDYLNIPVPLAPQAAQPVIAQILDTLDTAIRETEALIDKLKAVKQGLLHDLLTRGIDAKGQLRPPQSEAPQLYKESPLGWIPREWEVVKLGAVLSELGQGWSPDCPSEPAGAGEWGVLKTTSVVWEGYNEEENKQLPVPFKPRPDLEVKSDDILITRAGPKSRVGVVVHVPSTRPQLMISDKIYRLRLLSSEVPAYFALALSAGYMQSAISRTVSGMAESQTNISQGVIKGLAILRPIREEQHAIVAHARAFDERLRAEALCLSKLQAQKNGLMDDLLTGRVRVTPLLESVQQANAATGA